METSLFHKTQSALFPSTPGIPVSSWGTEQCGGSLSVLSSGCADMHVLSLSISIFDLSTRIFQPINPLWDHPLLTHMPLHCSCNPPKASRGWGSPLLVGVSITTHRHTTTTTVKSYQGNKKGSVTTKGSFHEVLACPRVQFVWHTL